MGVAVERLARRLGELGYHVEATDFDRTRAGHWQRARGAWAWSFGSLGSQYAVSTLLGCDDWQVYTHHFTNDVTVSPCDACACTCDCHRNPTTRGCWCDCAGRRQSDG